MNYRDATYLTIFMGLLPAILYLLFYTYNWRKQVKYLSVLWFVAWLGVIPALLFLASHFPSRGRRWSMTAIDASSWVALIALLYIWTMFRMWTSESHYVRQWDTNAFIGIGIGVFLDVILWLRLLHWFYFRSKNKSRNDSSDHA